MGDYTTETLEFLNELAIPFDEDEAVRKLVEATTLDAIKSLAEMRLVALDAEGAGVLGLTDFGKRILLGLLWIVHEGLTYAPTARATFGLALGAIARTMTVDDLPEDVLHQLNDRLRDHLSSEADV